MKLTSLRTYGKILTAIGQRPHQVANKIMLAKPHIYLKVVFQLLAKSAKSEYTDEHQGYYKLAVEKK